MKRRDGTPEPNAPAPDETAREPYAAPRLTDHGSLEDHTQTRPFDGGGADFSSS